MSKPYLAFFDVDETLINMKSMFSFLKFYWQQDQNQSLSCLRYHFYKMKLHFSKWTGKPREAINRKYYENFSSANVDELALLGRKWWQSVSSTIGIYNYNAIRELRYHQKCGAEIVMVSGSMPACVDPLANELNVAHRLLTELEINNGKYTGKIIGNCNINQGKRQKILEFVKNYKHPIDLSLCYAYGDHSSDLPMLELVGHPVVVNNDKVLIQIAKERKWKIIN